MRKLRTSFLIRLRLNVFINKIEDRFILINGFVIYIFLTLLIFLIPVKSIVIFAVVFMGLSHVIIFPLLAIRFSRAVPN